MSSWFASVNELGIPDWQDAANYGRTHEWNLDRWRWEFTRRRNDYRHDFAQALEEIGQPVWEAADITAEDLIRLRGIRSLPFFHFNAKKYGLSEFFDPHLSDWTGMGPQWSHTGLLFGPVDGVEGEMNWNGEVKETPAPHLVSFTFDLSRPLAPQIEEVKADLTLSQGFYLEETGNEIEATKLHPAKWLMYLRLLDAKEGGASLSRMTNIILAGGHTRQDQRAAGNMLLQAQSMAFRFKP